MPAPTPPDRPRVRSRPRLLPAPPSGKPPASQTDVRNRWIIGVTSCVVLLLLLMLLITAGGLGLALAAGYFSSDDGGGGGSAPAGVSRSAPGGQHDSGQDKSGQEATPADVDAGDSPAGDAAGGRSEGGDSEPKNNVAEGEADAPSESSPAPPAKTGTYSVSGGGFFGIESEGQSFVYVIDCSNSMSGAPLRRAKAEIVRSIRSLGEAQRFFIIFFANSEFPMYYPTVTEQLVPATSEHVNRAAEWVTAFEFPGQTQPQEAMLRALRLVPDVIYFLTDGVFREGVVEAIRDANSGAVRINTVSFINRQGENLLKQIAEDSNGKYTFVP